jgi:uncharacterized protein YecE (DUF72 family)
MVDWFLGTMGFSYADWAGPFYPETLAQRNYLGHYARYFNAVEIDSTFYGTPRMESVQRWRTTVPEGFRFCLKTPRIITHEKGLQAAHLDMAEFLAVIRELREKLGVILIQLPPSFGVDRFEVLAAFLGELPTDLRFAVEFRHKSWHQAKTAKMLKAHGVSWVATEYPTNLPRGVKLTASFIYFRLIGRHGQFQQHDRERLDRSANLKWWQQHLQSQTSQADSIYGFFNNDYAGFGAGSCNRFKSLVRLPAPDLRPPKQRRLFECSISCSLCQALVLPGKRKQI